MAHEYEANMQNEFEVVEYLTEREVELINGMIEVQLNHAQRCDLINNRKMADKQKICDLERVALLEKILRVMSS